MLPLSAFTVTTSCPKQFGIDTISAGVKTALCITVVDEQGCPVDIESFAALADCTDEEELMSSVVPYEPKPLPEGWTARYRLKETWSATRFNLDTAAEVVDSRVGSFRVVLQDNCKLKPAIYLAELVIFDADNKVRLVDPRYLVIQPTLEVFSEGPITPVDVRMAMWDYCPGDNTLLDDLEFPDDQIIFCIRRPLDLWNEIPPDVYKAVPNNFPWRENWLRAVCGYLMVAISRLQRRNKLSYQAGGLTVNDKDSWPAYQQEGERLISEFKTWAQNKKIEINVSRGYGSIGSSYR